MTKIVFLIDNMPGPTAGTERQLLLLLEHLDRTRFEPLLVVLRPTSWLRNHFNLCETMTLNINSLWNPFNYLKIWQFATFLRKSGTNVLMTYFRDANIVGILAGLITRKIAIVYNRRNQGHWMNHLDKLLQKVLNKRIDLFLTNSQSTKNLLTRKEFVPPNLIQVIYNSVDENRLSTSPDLRRRTRAKMNLSRDEKAFVNISNLRGVKGLDVFLKAAALVNRELPGTTFHIIGDGPDKETLSKLARSLNIEGSVTFHGYQPEAGKLLGAFDAAVLSSNAESFSNSLIEYVMAGLPVVTTSIGGSEEIICEGINGWVVPVGDVHALADRMLRAVTVNREHFLNEEDFTRFSLKKNMELYELVFSYLGAHPKIFRRATMYQRNGLVINLHNSLARMKRFFSHITAFLMDRLFILDAFKKISCRNSIRILNYHMVNPVEHVLGLSILPDAFENHLEVLKRKFSIISLQDAVEKLLAGKIDNKYVVLTFDDGFKDNFQYAYPILKKHGVPATIFVATDAILAGSLNLFDMDVAILETRKQELDLRNKAVGTVSIRSTSEKIMAIRLLHILIKTLDRTRRDQFIMEVIRQCNGGNSPEKYMLTSGDIQEMAREKLVEFGAHSKSHSILSRLTTSQIQEEIQGSKKALEDITQNPVLHFSYPNGKKADYDFRVLEVLRKSGFVSACTTQTGVNWEDKNLLELNRIDITPGISTDARGRFSPSLFYYRLIRYPSRDYSGSLI